MTELLCQFCRTDLTGVEDAIRLPGQTGKPRCRPCDDLATAVGHCRPDVVLAIVDDVLPARMDEEPRPPHQPTWRMVWAHFRRTLRHKWWVAVAGRRLGATWWRLLVHDLSKYSRAERRAYAARFHQPVPESMSPEVDTAFTRAWRHHLRANDHHWQSWLMFGEDEVRVLEMPRAVAVEMVADWAGTGRTIGGRWELATWYAQNRDRILLHPKTRHLVDGLVRRWVREYEDGAWPEWKSRWEDPVTTDPGTDGTVRAWSPRPAEWTLDDWGNS